MHLLGIISVLLLLWIMRVKRECRRTTCGVFVSLGKKLYVELLIHSDSYVCEEPRDYRLYPTMLYFSAFYQGSNSVPSMPSLVLLSTPQSQSS